LVYTFKKYLSWRSNLPRYLSYPTLLLKAVAIWTFCLVLPANAAETTHMVNKVAAVVNGEMISLFDIQRYSLQEITRQGLNGSDAKSEALRQKIFQQTLDGMIMDILIRQEAARFKVSVSDAEVDNEVLMLMQRSQMTPKQFENQLLLQGSSLKQFKENIQHNILRQRMMSLMVARKIVVTKEEVASYYQEHQNEFTTQYAVDVAMILIGPMDNADNIRNDLVNGKLSFEEAARKYSSAPNALDGGRMGSIPWKDLNPDWRKVLVNMKAGEVSPVIRSGNAAYLLRLNTTIEDTSLSLEEAAPEIEDRLRQPKLSQRFEEYYEQLRKNAVVDIRL
jgi:peptidyl-prolyl cis-trans isomerase SurA